MNETLQMILSALSGGVLTGLVTIPSVIRKAKAEARSADLDNLQKAMDGWHTLADERQEANRDREQQIKGLNQRIDTLNAVITERYQEIGDWRTRYHEKCEELSALRIKEATNEVRLCQVRNCKDRTPPTGF
ncbi:MAG: hypothetical protein IJ764_00455 [Bacteroidales bacterium]|nr:hypothetical protein [Bacteroidales bacterium]